ncbi:MAG: hypothetical protein LBI18_09880, partial [Planctomycetaceae bacterium]|nr:hypothetical protein [Planctomycetaceae bacterium]
MVELLVVIA